MQHVFCVAFKTVSFTKSKLIQLYYSSNHMYMLRTAQDYNSYLLTMRYVLYFILVAIAVVTCIALVAINEQNDWI